MSRKTLGIVLGVFLLLGVGGFAVVRLVSARNGVAVPVVSPKPAKCVDAYMVLKLTPSQIAAANSVCLAQALELSGEVPAGPVGQAYTVGADTAAPVAMCSVPKRWSGFPQVRLAFVVGGRGYRLRIAAPGNSEHQRLTLTNLDGVVELASIADPSIDWSQASGTLSLNADGITGSLDADLLRDVSGARPVHLTGAWACGAPSALPAFDASVPCASFYALNHLHEDDVARMKARACNAESLSFSGALSAKLDHAITDRAVSPHPGYGGDNVCSAVGEEYTATLKFSVGDESFLLDLDARKYPAVSPGRYSAQTGAAAGMVLFLGRADPDNHGEFITDDQVAWIGSAGSFTIAPDMKSGTVQARLSGLGSHSGSTIEISGSWRCAA